MTSNLSSTSHSDKDDRAVYQLVFGEEFGAYVYERVQDGLGDLPTYINSFVVREMWSRPGST